MKKATGKISILSLLACLSLAGTGLAAWIFGVESIYDYSANVGVNVTPGEEISNDITFEVREDLLKVYLELDQSAITFKSRAGSGFAETDEVFPSITIDVNGEAEAGSHLVLSYEWTISSGLATYVSLTEGVSGSWEDGIAISVPALEYTPLKPSNILEHQEMIDALIGEAITLTLHADVEAD
ncbi:MAG TPA: hypothetical protein PKC96_07565 [Bacilli bacterium]|nr:hypothetical protein [Bacilli bacterium]